MEERIRPGFPRAERTYKVVGANRAAGKLIDDGFALEMEGRVRAREEIRNCREQEEEVRGSVKRWLAREAKRSGPRFNCRVPC